MLSNREPKVFFLFPLLSFLPPPPLSFSLDSPFLSFALPSLVIQLSQQKGGWRGTSSLNTSDAHQFCMGTIPSTLSLLSMSTVSSIESNFSCFLLNPWFVWEILLQESPGLKTKRIKQSDDEVPAKWSPYEIADTRTCESEEDPGAWLNMEDLSVK